MKLHTPVRPRPLADCTTCVQHALQPQCNQHGTPAGARSYPDPPPPTLAPDSHAVYQIESLKRSLAAGGAASDGTAASAQGAGPGAVAAHAGAGAPGSTLATANTACCADSPHESRGTTCTAAPCVALPSRTQYGKGEHCWRDWVAHAAALAVCLAYVLWEDWARTQGLAGLTSSCR